MSVPSAPLSQGLQKFSASKPIFNYIPHPAHPIPSLLFKRSLWQFDYHHLTHNQHMQINYSISLSVYSRVDRFMNECNGKCILIYYCNVPPSLQCSSQAKLAISPHSV